MYCLCVCAHSRTCACSTVTTMASAGFHLSRYSKDEKTPMTDPQGVVGRPQSEETKGLHECDSALWCLYPGDAHGLSREDLN